MAKINRRLIHLTVAVQTLMLLITTVGVTAISAFCNQNPEGENEITTPIVTNKIYGTVHISDDDDAGFVSTVSKNVSVVFNENNPKEFERLESKEDPIDDDFVQLVSEEENIWHFNGTVLSEWEVNLVVQMILHELGSDPKFFPGYDFDYIQQCEARLILNRVGTNGWSNITEILLAPNQFITNLSEITEFDAYEPRTRQNVLTVLANQDSVPEGMICSMSWPYDMPVSEALAKQSALAGFDIERYEVFYANYGDFKQLCIFGCLPSSDSTT